MNPPETLVSISAADLVDRTLAPRGLTEAVWKLDASNPVIYLPNPAIPSDDLYWWPLERLTDSARVLDFIAQVSQKRWASDRILASLVRSLDGIFHVQATFCPGGQNKGMSTERIRESVADARALLDRSPFQRRMRARAPLAEHAGSDPAGGAR